MTESDPGGGLRDTFSDQLMRSARRTSSWRHAAYAMLDQAQSARRAVPA